MHTYIRTDLRDPRPTNPAWAGLTLQDALHGLDHWVAAGAEVLPDLLRSGPGGSGFVALRLLGTERPSLELSPAPSRLVVIPSDYQTPTLLSDLGRLPLLAFDGAEAYSRLAEANGCWPRSYLCLLTMVRVLENGATAHDRKPLSLELDAVLKRYGLPHGPEAGNPTPQLHRLRGILLGRLSKEGLWPVYQLESQLMPVTHRMRSRGIRIDATRLEKVRADYEARAATAATKLRAALNHPDLNPDDNAAVLAALQSTGLPVAGTSKGDLCRHSNHAAVQALRTYREAHGVHAAAKTYLAAIGKDGRIHPQWISFGAETGRYSCSDPAFQGLPKNPDLRRCFLPRDGFVFVSADLAQADLRPLTSASQDSEMLAIFQEGRDFHRETAAKLLGKPLDDVTDQERAVSKAVVFGMVYGMGPESLAEQALLDYGLVWTMEEAQDWTNRFFDIYAGLRAWREALRQEANTATECRTLHLKRRRFLTTDPKDTDYPFRCMLTMPAQGTVADAVKQAMINIAAKLDLEDAIIANLHDELLLEVRVERAEEVARVVQMEMESALANMLCGVPVQAKAGIYANWAKAPCT